MEVITELSLDLSCRTAPLYIYAKQGDSDSRFVKATFTDNGEAVDLSEVARSEIRVQKPDGTLTVNEGATPADGAILFPLSEQSLTAAGEAKVDFILYDSNNAVISAIPANMAVIAAAVGDDEIVSTNEYKAFQKDFTALKDSVSGVEEQLGGHSFKDITAEEYAEITPDSNTVYYVTDEKGNVRMYLGSAECCRAAGIVDDAALSANGIIGVAAVAEGIE